MSGVLFVEYCKVFDMLTTIYFCWNRRTMVLTTKHMIGVSHISRVEVSWSVLLAKIRPWLV